MRNQANASTVWLLLMAVALATILLTSPAAALHSWAGYCHLRQRPRPRRLSETQAAANESSVLNSRTAMTCAADTGTLTTCEQCLGCFHARGESPRRLARETLSAPQSVGPIRLTPKLHSEPEHDRSGRRHHRRFRNGRGHAGIGRCRSGSSTLTNLVIKELPIRRDWAPNQSRLDSRRPVILNEHTISSTAPP